MQIKQKLNQREKRAIDEAITNCSAAEPSDPFVARRIAAHFKSGVANFFGPEGPTYAASSRIVTKKLPNGQEFSNGGTEYSATEYFNQKRP